MHVVFYIAPFAGHVKPSLPLVRELAGRGHRVSYATTAEFARAVGEAGARALALDAAGPPRSRPAVAAEPKESTADIDFARNLGGQLRELGAVLPLLIAAFAHDPPDLVVCDPMCWAGRALAGHYRVPPVNSVTTLIGSAHWSLGSISASFDPSHRRLPQLFAAVSAVLASCKTGLTAAHLLGADGAIAAIAHHPRAFEPAGDQFGPDIHFVGPCLPPPDRPQGDPGDDRQWRPSGDGPVIAVSLGTVFNRQPALFRRCLDALGGTSCQVVAALGGMEAASLGTLPPNVEVHDYLPLPQLLRHADVLVGHAGMRSTMEALSYGVPIAALPQMPEQRATAVRLAELGLGLCLEPAQQTQEGVLSAVTALLGDGRPVGRLTWMQAEIEAAPGAAGAADAVEGELAGDADLPRPRPSGELPREPAVLVPPTSS